MYRTVRGYTLYCEKRVRLTGFKEGGGEGTVQGWETTHQRQEGKEHKEEDELLRQTSKVIFHSFKGSYIHPFLPRPIYHSDEGHTEISI